MAESFRSAGLPLAMPGQKIGLLGGSFDPPHRGHVHISRQALRRFGLDQVWWLVSPGNPLKKDGPADFERRMNACRDLAKHPRIRVSDFEMRHGTRFTADTIALLQGKFPRLNFVWLMGADNLVQLHEWNRWQEIMQRVPVGVFARPDNVVKAGLSRASRTYAGARLPQSQSGVLGNSTPPCWCLVTGPTVDVSSTEIRNRGEWVR